MAQAVASLFKRMGEWSAASQRRDYEKTVSRVLVALDSGKLKINDKSALATPFIDAGLPGWLSPFDGID